MPKVNYTRTVNPLQFDALEPKRFEDLVRQLLHDFRPWRQLEATGRAGSDDGFDARGWETSGGIADAETESEEEIAVVTTGDRIWLVQCKREKTIGPSRLIRYMDEISDEDLKTLHGIIFVACADFSKKARDEFRRWCVEHGISEFHLWGKAELEDALFQAKNDGLLFAYFGLSLTLRRRSEQARLRAQTTIKRKLHRAIEKTQHVLIRDAADEEYPFVQGDDDNFGWWVYARPKLTYRGLEVVVGRHFAFLDDDGKSWDFANTLNDAKLEEWTDPWRGRGLDREQRQELYTFWSELPHQNKAWIEVWGVIPFGNVVEVDELGDDIAKYPHIFVMPHPGSSRPFEHSYAELKQVEMGGDTLDPILSDRVEKFPTNYRKPLRSQLTSSTDSD
ncbi:restriction endonuclease [Agrobacterium leguminum]|uniref:restriction endonuclease n=1 Tax=Agrobacterium leguminum TaxID=2792015 RepID=UPI0022B810AA|nr:restriction endonuclease [Agrobacterium leguminum]MCZ7933561.1 restriction endonuclease [Agrobacterium leguminum]